MVGPEMLPRIATVDDAAEVGRLLHQFNAEFNTPSPGAKVLGERLTRLLADDSVFASRYSTSCTSCPSFAARESVPPSSTYSINRALANRIDAVEINVDEGDVDTQRFDERHGYSSIEPDTNERASYSFQEITPTG